MVRLGGWLFPRRGVLPVPLLVLQWVFHARWPGYWALGLVLLLAGEVLRTWAAGHIGGVSRTRGDEVGPLVASGPYRWLRNPLYLGNILLLTGLGLCSGLVWGGAWLALVLPYYAAIVRWEESRLSASLGEPYSAYLSATPRWWPKLSRSLSETASWQVSRAIRSERSTWLALALVLGLFCVR